MRKNNYTAGKPIYTIINNTVRGANINAELEALFAGVPSLERKEMAVKYSIIVCHLLETSRVLDFGELPPRPSSPCVLPRHPLC